MEPTIREHMVDLRVDGVERRFGDVVALAGASLEVRRGELVSVLGPSGCGKSTLLQLVAGHLDPDAGRIEICGEVAFGDGRSTPARARGVGMVFQDFALFPHMTVLENVAFGVAGVAARGLRGRLRRRRAELELAWEALQRFDIAHLAERHPDELSGGQRQRVAIARAIAQQPRLLLLDEPFCNLDVTTREQVRSEIVESLRATGLSCVFVTHDQEEALAVSDRVAVMQAGQVVQVDDPESLYRRPFCIEVAEFLGRTNVLHGVAHGDHVVTELGRHALAEPATGDVDVLVRPEQVALQTSALGTAIVVAREFRGRDVMYTIELTSGTRIWVHRPSIDMADVGDTVLLSAQPGPVSLVASAQSPAPGSPAEPAAEVVGSRR